VRTPETNAFRTWLLLRVCARRDALGDMSIVGRFFDMVHGHQAYGPTRDGQARCQRLVALASGLRRVACAVPCSRIGSGRS
jgi:hypothetical protein